MANKIDIQVELESKLKEASNDLATLKKHKVFDGPSGEKTLTKLNGILQRLGAVNLSNLKGTELTKFLNEFSKLRSLLDSSSRSLTVYTKEFEEQQKVVNASLKELNQRKSIKSEKLQLKKDALNKVNLQGHTYFNKSTGKQVSNIETIAQLFKDNLLEIRGEKGKKPISEENYNKIAQSTGIKGYSDASVAYEKARMNVEAQQVIVNGAQAKLKGLPQSGDIHPVTEEIQRNSANAETLFSNIREIKDEETEKDINNTTNAINKQIPTIDKQTSSLGRAFKQFTLYAIGVRAAKTALREAVQTVKELDKYLTEQAMVTGLTRKQTYDLVKEYQNLALQCGATTKEIASVATEYMKQGKTINDSLTLTKAAVSAAKVARVSVSDSVNYLTTALNGFQLAAEDAMKVSDKFAAVAASSATDYDELAIALSKVASQANLAGMSIDYTTALLTKGLETTREAPETMGTALKTIIARMRELSDYGETLEGDTDINNVESQLSYVGIKLKDTNGELRSTEDVLDELGKKWDTLNKNQQAAIAKALAGTRQQSRLIAMMSDYERVIELQEIAQRSAGATAAQAGVYLEGIEASMNQIQVAWEKIIMSLSDSEFIIEIFSSIGNILDTIGNFLSTDWGLISTLTLASTLGVHILGNKMRELGVAQALATEARLKEISEKKALLAEKKASILAKEQVLLAKKQGAEEKFSLNIQQIKTKLQEGEISDEQAQLLMTQAENDLKKDEVYIQNEIDDLKSEEMALEQKLYTLGAKGYGNWTNIASTITTAGGGIMSLITGSTAWLGIMTAISLVFKAIPPVMALISVATKKQRMEELKGFPLLIAKMYAKAASDLGPIAGPIAATALLAGITGLVGVGVAASMGAFKKQESKTTASQVNQLSNEIYKLNEKANEINNITENFDKLDNKLIQTNADLKEMSSLLDQAADKLDTEVDKEHDWYGGQSEKEYYESFSTNAGKRRALELIEKNNRTLANEARKEQIKKLNGMSDTELARFLDDNASDAEIRQAQDAIFALNNNKLYEYIDAQKKSGKLTSDQAQAVESLTQSILEGMSAEEAWAYVKENDGKKVQTLTSSLQELNMFVKDVNGKMIKLNVGSILNSDDYSLKDQLEAFKNTRDVLFSKYGENSAEFQAFRETFGQYEYFTRLKRNSLDFIDSSGMSINELNDLYGAWEKLQKKGVKISQEEWESNFNLYLETLAATQGDVLTTTQLIFGQHLKDSEDALNAFVEAYGDLIQVGILNMGQNMDKIKNSINGFYEKAIEWNTMSESDKAEFIQDNAELFSDGTLLKAFESGNYADIENALSNNQALLQQIEKRKQEIEQELFIEEARNGKERNEAYINELKNYKKYLNDTENLFKASIEIRLEQEQKQLEEYRSYLEDQQKALEESLNKRRKAYEKYFNALSKNEEDAEYEEEAGLLTSNLSKLGASNNASAIKQRKELEQELKDLEKERLKELRERAQEAILENMDDELEEINEKFDKLLDSNQALLAAMHGDLDNPLEFLTNLIGNKIELGATALDIEDYMKGLQSTYGNILDNNVNWDAIRVREENNQLFLNVNGTDIALDTGNEQNLYQAIMKALREIGLR